MEENNKVYWVKGNTQTMLIPLEQEVMSPQDEIVAEPYYPAEGAVVTVSLVGKYSKKSYTPIVDGNLLRITDDGTIAAGVYSVEVLVVNPDSTRLRSMWENQVVVTTANDSVLQEWDEFRQLDVNARAALFFFAKGDKGEKGDQGDKGDDGNYTKPASGIPSTDMTQDVQESLSKADQSLQEVTQEQYDEIFND